MTIPLSLEREGERYINKVFLQKTDAKEFPVDRTVEAAISSLMSVYAQYFVEDFAGRVMGHLQASVPVDETYLNDFITNQAGNRFSSESPIDITAVNPVTRFLYECSEYAIEKGIEDPEDRMAYESLRDLPSIHHDEINELVFSSALLYKKTIDETILGVVGTDARQARETIEAGAKSRTSVTETGGRVNVFTWGILSDGLWLNGALLRAFDMASIFRPGDQVVSYYATVAFDFARQYTVAPILPEGLTDSDAYAQLDVLISHGDDTTISSILSGDDQGEFASILLTPGVLSNYIDGWELGLKGTDAMVKSVANLSDLAVLLQHLIDVSKNLPEEIVISDFLLNRLDSVYNVVTLCLCGFEALRESRYNEALILCVGAPDNDPTVDVIINSDLVNSYKAAGGAEGDLVHVGAYLDPRKGHPPSIQGWSLAWVLERKDDIVADIVSDQIERTEALRANDAAVIQSLIQQTLRNLVQSYADAKGLSEIPIPVNNRINEISRLATGVDVQTGFNLEQEILNLLINVISDPFVSQVTDRLTTYASSEEEDVRKNARALTVAETAVDDAVSFLRPTEEEQIAA